MSADEIITEDLELNADCLALSEDEIKDCRTLKVAELTNLFWTNGSREKPLNVPPDNLFKELNDIKIDWITGLLGKIKLCGDYNYAMHRGGYYFMSKVRPVDIDKKIYVYSLIKDLWMSNYISDDGILVGGCLSCTNDEDLILSHLHLTKPMISAPNTISHWGIAGSSAGCIAGTTTLKHVTVLAEGSKLLDKRQNVITVGAYKNFLTQLRAASDSPGNNISIPPTIAATLRALTVLHWKARVLRIVRDFLIKHETNLMICECSNFANLNLTQMAINLKTKRFADSAGNPITKLWCVKANNIVPMVAASADGARELSVITIAGCTDVIQLDNLARDKAASTQLTALYPSEGFAEVIKPGKYVFHTKDLTKESYYVNHNNERINAKALSIVQNWPTRYSIYNYLANAQNAGRPYSEGIADLKFVVGVMADKASSETNTSRSNALYWKGSVHTREINITLGILDLYFSNKTHGFKQVSNGLEIDNNFQGAVIITESSIDNKADALVVSRVNFEAGKIGYGIRYYQTYSLILPTLTYPNPIAPVWNRDIKHWWYTLNYSDTTNDFSVLTRSELGVGWTVIKGAEKVVEPFDLFKGFYPAGKSVAGLPNQYYKAFFAGGTNMERDMGYTIKWHAFSTGPTNRGCVIEETTSYNTSLNLPFTWALWPKFISHTADRELKPTMTVRIQGKSKQHMQGEGGWGRQTSWAGFAFGWKLKDIKKCINYADIVQWIKRLGISNPNDNYEFWIIMSQERWYGPWATAGTTGVGTMIPIDPDIAEWKPGDITTKRAVPTKVGFYKAKDIVEKLSYCSTTTLNSGWLRSYATKFGITNTNTKLGYADLFLSEFAAKFGVDDVQYDSKTGTYLTFTPNWGAMQSVPQFFDLVGTEYVAVIMNPTAADIRVELILKDPERLKLKKCETIALANNDAVTDVIQAVNQQNILYVYGVTIPLLSKFVLVGKPIELENFSIKEMQYAGADAAIKPVSPFKYYRLYLKHDLDTIDQVITKMKPHQITVMKDVAEYENLKLAHMTFDHKKHYETLAYNEAQRKTLTSLDIEQTKYSYDTGAGYQYKSMENVATGIGGIIGGLASVVGGVASATTGLNPLGGGKLMGYGSAAIVGGITRGFGGQSQLEHNVGIAGKTLDNHERAAAADLFINNMNLVTDHKIHSMKLRNELFKFNSNIHMGNINDWDIEQQYINELGYGMAVHIKHFYPTGRLHNMLWNYFNRYGADIFLDNYQFNIKELNLKEGEKRIVQFEIIDELNIPSVKIRSVIKEMFMNGVMIINNKF